MSGEKSVGRPLTGQVMPARQNESHLPIESPLSGVPLFNRMRYNALRKELVAYVEVLQARNAAMHAINDTVELREQYHLRLARAENWDLLRAKVGLEIEAELDAALDKAVEQREIAQLNALQRRAQRAALEAQAVLAERRLEEIKNPPPPLPPAPVHALPPPRSRSERLIDQIGQLRRDEKAMIEAFVEQFGGEDEIPEEDRELIEDMRLWTRDQVAKLMGQ